MLWRVVRRDKKVSTSSMVLIILLQFKSPYAHRCGFYFRKDPPENAATRRPTPLVRFTSVNTRTPMLKHLSWRLPHSIQNVYWFRTHSFLLIWNYSTEDCHRPYYYYSAGKEKSNSNRGWRQEKRRESISQEPEGIDIYERTFCIHRPRQIDPSG